jgi:hypothetical protein
MFDECYDVSYRWEEDERENEDYGENMEYCHCQDSEADCHYVCDSGNGGECCWCEQNRWEEQRRARLNGMYHLDSGRMDRIIATLPPPRSYLDQPIHYPYVITRIQALIETSIGPTPSMFDRLGDITNLFEFILTVPNFIHAHPTLKEKIREKVDEFLPDARAQRILPILQRVKDLVTTPSTDTPPTSPSSQ